MSWKIALKLEGGYHHREVVESQGEPKDFALDLLRAIRRLDSTGLVYESFTQAVIATKR